MRVFDVDCVSGAALHRPLSSRDRQEVFRDRDSCKIAVAVFESFT